jgi:hypothetical protein
MEEKLFESEEKTQSIPDKIADFLELVGKAYSSYKIAIPEEKRDLLKIITSNRIIDEKNVVLELNLPFSEIENRSKFPNGSPFRDRPRTVLDNMFDRLCQYFTAEYGVN